ncbi:MAG: twin-arginine translocase TatA/TatE family subunit [Limnochordaceae bacterium]|uniref:Sec-independent protein translocase protein TatA n=1 Tax=Carboxydichorda subterranea TaxID=3109565 RepID=A0ABZ1BYV3_9FIRM|nr:twin-arginine translocase TatA/TatE family subunit [Limnochorda sp. L945t]MBE3598753.1 twin-arginine translocase TatA/TatE family subunit [Limnochordaceae bacterium]WRP17981.1 twin-arginine translocase TatA/TatE family subunit [Limnochorda sp. L945t]
MPNIGPTELLVILLLALIIFGPGKLPQLGRAIGQSFREFKESVSGARQEHAETADKSKGQQASGTGPQA